MQQRCGEDDRKMNRSIRMIGGRLVDQQRLSATQCPQSQDAKPADNPFISSSLAITLFVLSRSNDLSQERQMDPSQWGLKLILRKPVRLRSRCCDHTSTPGAMCTLPSRVFLDIEDQCGYFELLAKTRKKRPNLLQAKHLSEMRPLVSQRVST